MADQLEANNQWLREGRNRFCDETILLQHENWQLHDQQKMAEAAAARWYQHEQNHQETNCTAPSVETRSLSSSLTNPATSTASHLPSHVEISRNPQPHPRYPPPVANRPI